MNKREAWLMEECRKLAGMLDALRAEAGSQVFRRAGTRILAGQLPAVRPCMALLETRFIEEMPDPDGVDDAVCHCTCHNDPLYCHDCKECNCHATKC